MWNLYARVLKYLKSWCWPANFGETCEVGSKAYHLRKRLQRPNEPKDQLLALLNITFSLGSVGHKAAGEVGVIEAKAAFVENEELVDQDLGERHF